jgi:hypothetical protein
MSQSSVSVWISNPEEKLTYPAGWEVAWVVITIHLGLYYGCRHSHLFPSFTSYYLRYP